MFTLGNICYSFEMNFPLVAYSSSEVIGVNFYEKKTTLFGVTFVSTKVFKAKSQLTLVGCHE